MNEETRVEVVMTERLVRPCGGGDKKLAREYRILNAAEANHHGPAHYYVMALPPVGEVTQPNVYFLPDLFDALFKDVPA